MFFRCYHFKLTDRELFQHILIGVGNTSGAADIFTFDKNEQEESVMHIIECRFSYHNAHDPRPVNRVDQKQENSEVLQQKLSTLEENLNANMKGLYFLSHELAKKISLLGENGLKLSWDRIFVVIAAWRKINAQLRPDTLRFLGKFRILSRPELRKLYTPSLTSLPRFTDSFVVPKERVDFIVNNLALKQEIKPIQGEEQEQEPEQEKDENKIKKVKVSAIFLNIDRKMKNPKRKNNHYPRREEDQRR